MSDDTSSPIRDMDDDDDDHHHHHNNSYSDNSRERCHRDLTTASSSVSEKIKQNILRL